MGRWNIFALCFAVYLNHIPFLLRLIASKNDIWTKIWESEFYTKVKEDWRSPNLLKGSISSKSNFLETKAFRGNIFSTCAHVAEFLFSCWQDPGDSDKTPATTASAPISFTVCFKSSLLLSSHLNRHWLALRCWKKKRKGNKEPTNVKHVRHATFQTRILSKHHYGGSVQIDKSRDRTAAKIAPPPVTPVNFSPSLTAATTCLQDMASKCLRASVWREASHRASGCRRTRSEKSDVAHKNSVCGVCMWID